MTKKIALLVTLLSLFTFQFAYAAETTISQPEVSAAKEYDHLFDLALKVMKHKELYGRFNKAFKDNLIDENLFNMYSAEVQNPDETAEISTAKNTYKQLSMSQIVYLLQNVPQYIPEIEKYLNDIPSPAVNLSLEQQQARRQYQESFDSIMASDPRIIEVVKTNYPAKPLPIRTKDGKPAFTNIQMFVNHPIFIKNKLGFLSQKPADDLRALVIDFISKADQQIIYNFFDFDLEVVAQALIKKSSDGVSILGGIDAGTIKTRPEVQRVVDLLTAGGIAPVAVNAVGLNHQKIIIRDPYGPKAAVLFLSGNLTQSCIGPEGDLVNIPQKDRPAVSIPNANHAILIEGTLPAIVAKQELNKVLIHKLRGESQYPIGGAYQLLGPLDSETKTHSWIVMTFSPNGGMGDINKDILVKLIDQTTGPLESVQFAFSSEPIQDAIERRVVREYNYYRKLNKEFKISSLFRSVGDTPFALREWSGFLLLSGLQKNLETNIYSENPQFSLSRLFTKEEMAMWQDSLRVAPARYGEKHLTLADGSKAKVTSKIHHKIWNIPENRIAVVGTSFNTSAGAETNNEQLLIVRDSKISKITSGLVEWLYRKSEGSVLSISKRRNLRPQVEPEQSDSEEGALKLAPAAGF